MKQSLNDIRIEGLLSEIDLAEKESKEGKPYIGGKIVLQVEQEIDGVTSVSEIPVKCFANQITKAGKVNPGYSGLLDVLNMGVSLAATNGNTAMADKYSVASANFRENAFPAKDGSAIIRYTEISGSFFNKVTSQNFNPSAVFTNVIIVKALIDEEKNEELTGRLLVQGIVVNYNDKCDTITFVVENPNSIEYIRGSWKVGDTVRVQGRIRWTTETFEQEVNDEVGFGVPETRIFEKTIKDFVITSGSPALDGDSAYNPEEIEAKMIAQATEQAAMLENAKNDSGSVANTTAGSSGFRGF